MKKERTIKELLQLMLKHQDLFDLGLCVWVINLNFHTTHKEHRILQRYIKENRPKNFYWLIGTAYYWESGDIRPRIKWLKKHIARL